MFVLFALLYNYYLLNFQVAMAELRLIRALEQVESLKDAGRWSFRQPKKQRGVGGLTKTHWDYVMDEMVRLLRRPLGLC